MNLLDRSCLKQYKTFAMRAKEGGGANERFGAGSDKFSQNKVIDTENCKDLI
jgi:hypothetical protein